MGRRLAGDLAPARRFVVYPGRERFPLRADVEAISLPDLGAELLAAA